MRARLSLSGRIQLDKRLKLDFCGSDNVIDVIEISHSVSGVSLTCEQGLRVEQC